ncbi:MAG: thioredoxin-disulfide reductase [Candidatus Palauibacterales bacterium]|nr:thioredoxin-disulfide reductase [Candidatus Palauibacterales bacterium]
MTTTQDHELIIVGAGPAGLCAALYAGRSEMDAVLLEQGAPGGQLLLTELVDDYPGLEEVGGLELAERMTEHAAKFGVESTYGVVESIRRDEAGRFLVAVSDGTVYRSSAVVLTAGGTPRRLGVPGEEEFRGQGVSYCAICDGAFFKGQTIAVVGGGDSAVEEGEFLTRYAEKVYVIHRREAFRAQAVLEERLLRNPRAEVIWNTVVEEIRGDDSGVASLALRDVGTGETSELPVTGVFIFIGFDPNTTVLAEHVEHDAGGYLLTDRDMRTSVPGLFAAGDVRSQLVRQITTAVGDATTAVFAAEKYLVDLAEREGSESAAAGSEGAAAPAGATSA